MRRRSDESLPRRLLMLPCELVRAKGTGKPEEAGVRLGVHNPRTLRPFPDSSDMERGQRIAKSFVRCPLPGALKSLGPLACVGSTPTPGTSVFSYLEKSVG